MSNGIDANSSIAKPQTASDRQDDLMWVTVDDFNSDQIIPFGTIGEIVDVRTYRRWLHQHNRRETAIERWVRVINYNLGLVAHLHTYDELRSEGLLMAKKFSALKADASGRTKWVGGTEAAKKNSASQFNCAGLAVNRLSAFAEAFELLMVGSGVGYRVFQKDIDQLPTLISKNVEIECFSYAPVPKNLRLEDTEFVLGHDLFVLVGDSRKGWIDAVMTYLTAVTTNVYYNKIVFDFSSIRPAGERLNGFGGTASGPDALKGIITDIHRIIKECPGDRLRSIDCMDIMCAIAKGVVAGSSRRCLPKGTLVNSESGLKAIESITTDDRVYASDGKLYPVKNTFSQGIQSISKINTNGNPFYATSNHKMAVMTDAKGGYNWKELQDLVVGDTLLHNLIIFDGKPTTLPVKMNEVRPPHSTTCKDFTVPELTEDVAWFIGYFHGNGYVNNRPSGFQLSATMNSDNYELAERVKNGFSLFGDDSAVIYKRHEEKTLEVKVNNTRLGEYFFEHVKQANEVICIPTWILESQPSTRAAYLAGLLDADGCVKTRPIILVSTVYKGFVEQVAAMYSSLGIPTRVRVQNRPEENWQNIYHLRLIGFKKEFNCLIAPHSFKGYLSLDKNGQKGYQVPGSFVKSAIQRQTYFTQWDGTGNMNFESYQKASNHLLPFVPITVESVEFDVDAVETYDIEVETKHEFFANGILTHNSAMICLFQQNDSLCAEAKKGLYTNPDLAYKSYRSQSNNTACLTDKPTLDEIRQLLATCKTEGEPGFNNYSEMVRRRANAAKTWRPDQPVENYVDVVTNPCFDAGTMVLTRDGHYPIETLVGKSVEVWDGERWVLIDNFRVTAYDQDVYQLTINRNGIFYDVFSTAYHNYILEDDTTVQLKDLKSGCKLKTHNLNGGFFASAIVVAVEFSHVADEVYCCTVPTNHRFSLSNGLVVGQCHEILLSAGINNGKSGSFCNLVTLPLPNFVKNEYLDLVELEKCVRLNTRISLRQTFVDIPMEGWNETQQEERLLGVSITGWQDAFNMMGLRTGDPVIESLLQIINRWANDEATLYSDTLQCPRPLLVTTIKPEGTGSQVFGCSSGLHWDWAPYYIRRVQMSSTDALAQTLITQGFPCYPTPYDLSTHFLNGDTWDKIKQFDQCSDFDKRDILNRSNAVIFEFPVKSYSDRTQAEVNAIEQLENLKVFTNHYCDHMPSVTISVKEHEWDEVAFWLDQNWDSFITASFFPYFDAKYPLLPYEAISQGEYESRLDAIPSQWKHTLSNGKNRFVIDELYLNKVEWEMNTDVDLSSDCQSGSCPVR